MRRRIRGASGFTLVEVVVTLALLSAIMLGLMTALVTFADTGSRLEKRALESDDVRLVHGFLRQSLGAASPRLHFRSQDAVSTVWLSGAPDRLEWLGLLPARHGMGGLHHLLLDLDHGADEPRLVLCYTPYVGDEVSPDWGSARHLVLFERVSGFALAFKRLDSESWLSVWQDPEVLPGHVSLSLELDGARWPDLIVQVLAAEPGVDVNQEGR